MNQENKFEVIFCIVNHGFTDVVMEAAKKNGARGGTIMNARGTATEETEKFYGIAITPEKEIVMIIVEHEKKESIMKAIYDEA